MKTGMTRRYNQSIRE